MTTERSAYYELIYRAAGCWDDGGIGHDLTWSDCELRMPTERPSEWGPHTQSGIWAESDSAARARAREFLAPNPARGCRGFACDNRGQRVFVSLVLVERIHTENRRLGTISDTERRRDLHGLMAQPGGRGPTSTRALARRER
jgi:hypothetical protein